MEGDGGGGPGSWAGPSWFRAVSPGLGGMWWGGVGVGGAKGPGPGRLGYGLGRNQGGGWVAGGGGPFFKKYRFFIISDITIQSHI